MMVYDGMVGTSSRVSSTRWILGTAAFKGDIGPEQVFSRHDHRVIGFCKDLKGYESAGVVSVVLFEFFDAIQAGMANTMVVSRHKGTRLTTQFRRMSGAIMFTRSTLYTRTHFFAVSIVPSSARH